MASEPEPSSTPPADLSGARFHRDGFEFGRALTYFDATFAIATTLLVTTLASGNAQWESWTAFRSATSGPLFAYALSFVVVSTFWWANHRLVASLSWVDGRFVIAGLAMLLFVVLIPFTTEGLGTFNGVDDQVPTVVYAVNVAAVALAAFVVFRVAVADDLFTVAPTRREILERSVRMLDVPFVFLLSVPVALFWSDSAARYCWLALVPLGILERRWMPRGG
jgi:uncharacterized membrane protein